MRTVRLRNKKTARTEHTPANWRKKESLYANTSNENEEDAHHNERHITQCATHFQKLPKARAKLRGELPPSLMYSCGGDRRFFKEHDILPAEFLNLVWRLDSDEAIVDWVLRRKATP